MTAQINGIQQIGIGVHNVKEAYNWYSKIFGFDILVFEDIAKATLMQQYTGSVVQERHAILAMNLQSGGGVELWQNTNQIPVQPLQEISIGDTGIFAIKIKAKSVLTAYNLCVENKVTILQTPTIHPVGKSHFFIKDLNNNVIEIIEDDYWYINDNKNSGGISGVIIGVSNMEASIHFYKDIAQFDTIIFDEINCFIDFEHLNGGKEKCRRVLLTKKKNCTGAFGALLGPATIELVQLINKKPAKIFANRHWGDAGFIHICFDINNMQAHEKRCTLFQYPFTVNSINGFDMGQASGHFTYNEDPDGTLIEYVETYKVPIVKKLGINYHLKQKNTSKNLPKWFIKLFKFARVRKK
jgi:catechol 2,3-dioxygenase-like lactoylglutathione lyase family enzyme